MIITITTKKFGIIRINTETFIPMKVSSSSAIFRMCEYLFDNWYDDNTQTNSALAKDIRGCYYGEADQPAIYYKRGAIVQAIETLIEICEEENLTNITSRDVARMDLEACFQI